MYDEIINHCQQFAYKPNTHITQDTFYVKRHDSLFWCLYVIIYGIDEFNRLRGNKQNVKTQLKYKMADALNATDIENITNEMVYDFVSNDDFSIDVFIALCVIHNKNVIFKNNEIICTNNPVIYVISQIHMYYRLDKIEKMNSK